MNENQLLKLRELSIGYSPKEIPLPQIRNSSDAYRLLKELFEPNSLGLNEQFVVLYMNRANRVIGGLKAFKGGISATVVDHRIIFATALKVLASGIVIAHNHPSNNLQPSDADLELTKKIKEAGKLLDINLLDHLILGTNDNYVSFTEKGWL